MNELDKTLPSEESAIPTAACAPSVNPETSAESPVDATEDAETPASGEQPVVAAEQPAIAEETATVTVADEPAPAAEAETAVIWHSLSKQELVDALGKIVGNASWQQHKDVAAIKQAFHSIRTKELDKQMADFLEAGNSPDAFAALPDEDEYRFKDLMARFKEGRTQFLAEEEERLNKNLEAKKKVIDDIKNIVDDIDNINLHFPRFQELQNEFKAIKDVPPSADTEIWKEYQSVVELFYDRLKMNKELRDLDFKKNLEAKKQLIEKARELENENDVIAAFRKLQELHSQWREIGPVAKEFREPIWAEFSAASTAVNKRHQQYFESRKADELANETAKTKLCEEIEAFDFSNLDTFKKWEAMTKDVLELQQRWKTLGFASRKVNNQLFARFRKVCDDFFAAKAEYYKRVKDELNANLEKKTALCEQVEALLEAEDRSAAAEKVVALQAEWKTVGGVARRHSDAIWQRFTAACNKFFEERKRVHSAQRKEETENLAAKREIIEKLKLINPSETDRKDGIPAVRELQKQWQTIGHVPYKMKDKLYEEYRGECDRIFDGYDAAGSRRRMSSFEGRIEGMSAGDGKLSRERDRLYRAYEQKRAELKTFENNMGFFNIKSKGGDSMVREMEKRIAKIKEELGELKKKIELIDDKME